MGKQEKKSYFFHFLAGVASLNLFPTGSRVTRDILDKTDKEALYSDWLLIGGDMKVAIKQVKGENEQQEQKQASKI